jgi:hypothetical protein
MPWQPGNAIRLSFFTTRVDLPWGLNLDGNDDVWVANIAGRVNSTRSVVLLAGANPQGHATGTKPGDLIHVFTPGSLQILTDVAIDPDWKCVGGEQLG